MYSVPFTLLLECITYLNCSKMPVVLCRATVSFVSWDIWYNNLGRSKKDEDTVNNTMQSVTDTTGLLPAVAAHVRYLCGWNFWYFVLPYNRYYEVTCMFTVRLSESRCKLFHNAQTKNQQELVTTGLKYTNNVGF